MPDSEQNRLIFVSVRAQVLFAHLPSSMRTAVLCALLGLVCVASAARDMAPGPAPAPAPGVLRGSSCCVRTQCPGWVFSRLRTLAGPSAMLAPEVAPAGETAPAPAPAAELVCPCALEKGSYDVNATNLADILKSRANCPLDMTAGSGCPTGNYGYGFPCLFAACLCAVVLEADRDDLP